jgi:methylthioribulose-1-phosphate dehydratase
MLRDGTRPREVICELARRFYALGWASGTGGGLSIREGDRVFVAPSGVQKELLAPEDLFVVDLEGRVLEQPADPSLTPSACTPLFLEAFRRRGAGAVLHTHSLHAMTATLIAPGETFRVTHLEMIKGLAGHGYHDELVVPILENTAHERDLADALGAAIEAHPRASAVLVRRHGAYVWGADWRQAKTHAECLDYLFAAALEMKRLGLDPAAVAGVVPSATLPAKR